MKTIVCVDNRMGICFNGRRVSRDRMVSEDILEMTRGNVLWMAPEADKLFKEVFKAKEEVCRETGTGKKITEIVLYKWNRDYPADVFFEVDLRKWRLEERKDFSGYSHEKITKEIYNRQGLL